MSGRSGFGDHFSSKAANHTHHAPPRLFLVLIAVAGLVSCSGEPQVTTVENRSGTAAVQYSVEGVGGGAGAVFYDLDVVDLTTMKKTSIVSIGRPEFLDVRWTDDQTVYVCFMGDGEITKSEVTISQRRSIRIEHSCTNLSVKPLEDRRELANPPNPDAPASP